MISLGGNYNAQFYVAFLAELCQLCLQGNVNYVGAPELEPFSI